MKKYMICLCLITVNTCFYAASASSVSKAENKKLPLQLVHSVSNDTFMHLIHNPLLDAVGYVTFDRNMHSQSEQFAPLSSFLCEDTDITKYPLTLMGFTPIKKGLLAVIIQNINREKGKKVDKLIVLYNKLKQSAPAAFSTHVNAKIESVEVAERPNCNILATFLCKKNRSSKYKVQIELTMPFTHPHTERLLKCYRVDRVSAVAHA